MTLYSNSAFGPPFKTVKRMANGLQNYLFGNFDFDTEPFRFQISAVACTSDVATATVQWISGGGGIGAGVPQPIPHVGAKMGVQGTTTATGAYNVDPTTVSSVTLNSSGAGTITYPCTTANLATTADDGTLVVQPYEYPDLVSQGSASAPIALTFTPDDSDNSRCLFAEARWFGTMPSAATVVLQAANVDDDSRYLTVQNSQGCSASGVVASSDALATIATSAVTQAGAEYSFILGKFLRAKVLSMTGGDGTTGLVVTVFV